MTTEKPEAKAELYAVLRRGEKLLALISYYAKSPVLVSESFAY
jgi:hypothetical protein